MNDTSFDQFYMDKRKAWDAPTPTGFDDVIYKLQDKNIDLKRVVEAITKSVGQEVAPYGIRVNAVCPGWIDTPLLAPMDPMLMAGIVMQIPRGRLGTAQELAELVRFLCGPESSYCNGDVFAASGGFV